METPALAAHHKKERRYVLIAHATWGALLGALMGFYLWSRWGWRARFLFDSSALDSWPAFTVFVGGFAMACAVGAACLKERFWQDWRHPFWW